MLVIVGLGLLLVPAQAQAHALLVSSTPEAGSVLKSAPEQVTLTFNEVVQPLAERTQVLAPDGKRISESVTSAGNTVTIRLRTADRPLGTYLVSYRLVSADTHPVGNALIFSVGAPSARPAEADPTKVHGSVAAAVPTFKFLGYAGLTLAVGPALFLAFLWPRRLSRRGPTRMVRAGLALIGLATLGALWTQAPYASGAPLWDVSFTELSDVFTSSFGVTLTARLAVLALVAGLIRPEAPKGPGFSALAGGPAAGSGTAPDRKRGLALAALALGGLTTWPLTGHAAVSQLRGAVIAADVVHMAAMAVWLGGLVTLAAFLLRRRHARVLGVILPAWSRWATLAVVWLAGGGVVQAVVHVGSVPGLWETAYGRLLLAKTGILAVVLSAAYLARRFVLSRQVSAAGPARLWRTVGVEMAATSVILALSAVLVGTTPSRAVEQDNGPAVRNGYSETLSSNLYTLQFNIYPVELGEWNTVHGMTYTPEGKPLPAAQWTVTTRYADQDVAPVTEPMLPLPAPRNDALGSLTFPLPGTYEVSFTIRTTEIDQATVRTKVTVPASR